MPQPIPLCRVITWLPVGGIERRIVAVLPRLRELGWAPRVVCLREEGELAAELRAQDIPVDVVPFRSRLSPAGLLKLKNYFVQHQIRVAHSHMYRSNVPTTIAAKWAGVPVCFGQIHNIDSWDNSRQAQLDWLLSRHRTATITVSAAVQRDAMERLDQSKRRLPVLYNGIDVSEFTPSTDLRRKLRAELSIQDSDLVFLVPARLHRQKNPTEVLKAWQDAVGDSRAYLLFAGDGKLRAEMEALAAEDSRVKILGSRSDMAALYNAADAIILSSQREGFSNAVIEALACGVPVIASDVGGNREAVNSTAVGWIHPANDFVALKEQIGAALALGVEGLASMKQACRQRGEDFSLDVMIRQTDALYREALAKAGAL